MCKSKCMEEEEKYWSNLEEIFVHNVYERISSKYDEFLQHSLIKYRNNEDNKNSTSGNDNEIINVNKNTTYKLKKKSKIASRNKNEWPKVKQFLLQIEPYSLIGLNLADVGCGDGKYMNINSLIFPIGSDRSVSLSQLASYRDASNSTMCNKNQVVICDNLYLPFRSNLFDAVISIGVIHHLSTEKRRTKAIQELVRILKPGGKIMIYVWAMEQRLRKFKSQDVLVPMLNLNSINPKSKLKINLRRDLSNNSAVDSEDSNDDTVSVRFSRTVSLNSQTKDSADQELDENKEKLSSSRDDEVLFKQNLKKNENDLEIAKKNNFVESLKRFFSQKVLSKEEPCEFTETLSSSDFSKDRSLIQKPASIDKYKKIIDEHKDLLPKNFSIRKFPHSSCQDTFEKIQDSIDQKTKSEKTLNLCPLNTSSITSTNILCSPENKQDQNLDQTNSNEDGEDKNNDLNKRFYHVFTKGELDKLIKEHCPELVIYESYYDHGNWSICARKEINDSI